MPRRSAPSSSSPPRPTPIPAKFWRACAGISAQVPVVNSRVYYFPQGHIDQAASQPRNLSPLVYSRPVIPCRVAAVNFFADPNTDEVFLKILLLPVTDGSAQDFLQPAVAAEGSSGNGNGDEEKVESYAKILTRSDANNGGGFSVPRFCADLIFPPLNFEADPPVQTLRITDLHGAVWEFRHIYHGTPRRHLFTSGWSKFVNSKKIISGDTVVFMKDSDGRMFVGLRRNMTPDDGISDGGSDWLAAIVGMDDGEKEIEEEEEVMTEGFARNGKGRVSSASVAEAMELAAQNKPFEVVYYPSVGWGEFVVKGEDVDVKMNGILWSAGMRVKMARENHDSSRMTWFQGTVSGVTVPAEDQLWNGSPWRMLQITWDEPEILKNANSVSPWQVEPLSDTPSLAPLPQVFPPTKKFRTADGSGVFIDEVGEPSFSMTRPPIPDSAMGLLNQTLLSSYVTPFPASMQGARHPLFSAPTYPIFPINPPLSIGNSFENNVGPRLNALLPEPNIDTRKLENLSPHSKSSLTPVDRVFNGTSNSNSTKSGTASFQLFGCTIQTDQASDEIDDHSTAENDAGEDNIQ